MMRIRRPGWPSEPPRTTSDQSENSTSHRFVANDRAALAPIYSPVPSTWPRLPSISTRDRQDNKQAASATGPPRSLSREPAEKRRSPAHCAQETPHHQAFLRDIPSPDSEAIHVSFHLESQIDSDIQEHFNAYARTRGPIRRGTSFGSDIRRLTLP